MGVGAYTPSGQELARMLRQGHREQAQDRKRRQAEIRDILLKVHHAVGRNTGHV